MEIYFAGSIRGGRDDAALYRRLIDELGRYGTVLTEHIADPDLAEHDTSDQEIYAQDIDWLERADIVVAEVTTPSLGVGYEIARAETLGKPILCLFRPAAGRRLSAMVAGAPGPAVVAYETVEEAAAAIGNAIAAIDRAG
jgi:nucleoside 2-deoxyribosyltransferase